ncbi:MAG: metal-sulfur cluster assembly factor [Candidatus Krumholzibacteriia bacterium]
MSSDKPTPMSVLDGLRPVIDPELNLSIVDLGLVRGITIDDDSGAVAIDLTLTSPMCPMGPEIMAATKHAAEKVPGVAGATVNLVWSPMWDPRVDASDDAKAELGIWD